MKINNSTNNQSTDQDQEEVDMEPGKNAVSYLSKGEKIVAHLYLPEDYIDGEKRPAIAITPPASGVREQTIELYAEKLSHKGFITLAFDPRGWGESEGIQFLLDPHNIVEDTKNSASFIRSLEQVDANNVFNVGICMGSGFAACATAFDARVKALAIVSPYLDAADSYIAATNGSAGLRAAMLTPASAARQHYYDTGEYMMTKIVPETEEEIAAAQSRPVSIGMREYCFPGKPGNVPNWRNELNMQSVEGMTSFSIFNFTHMFDAVPVYVVYGDEAVTAGGAERFYQEVNGPKDKLVLEGAGHFDLYWMPEYVDPAVEGVSNFLKAYVQ